VRESQPLAQAESEAMTTNQRVNDSFTENYFENLQNAVTYRAVSPGKGNTFP
jgi:hypothetical protein